MRKFSFVLGLLWTAIIFFYVVSWKMGEQPTWSQVILPVALLAIDNFIDAIPPQSE